MMQWISAMPVTQIVAWCMIAITVVSSVLAFWAGLRAGGAESVDRSDISSAEADLAVHIMDGDNPHNTDLLQLETPNVSINNFSYDVKTGKVTMRAGDMLSVGRV